MGDEESCLFFPELVGGVDLVVRLWSYTMSGQLGADVSNLTVLKERKGR